MSDLRSKILTFVPSILMGYHSWRVGATTQERRCYNVTSRILLTFDDFGDPDTVRKILTILKTENVKAAFFLVGEWSYSHSELVGLMHRDGHWVGNHTNSHANLKQLSNDAVRKEILGGPKGLLLRPPFGAYDRRIRALANEYGQRIAFWSIDTKDWTGLPAKQLQDRTYGLLHDGACVLMHLNGPHTVEALPGLIAGIRARGYELCHEGNELEL